MKGWSVSRRRVICFDAGVGLCEFEGFTWGVFRELEID